MKLKTFLGFRDRIPLEGIFLLCQEGLASLQKMMGAIEAKLQETKT